MGLAPGERRRLERATTLALDWHARQQRKGSEVPYASHLLQVAGLVLEHGGDVDQAVAGLLHDCLEDAETPEQRLEREAVLRAEFGAEVLRMVLDCTDTEEHEVIGSKSCWKQRKTRYLEHLPRAGDRSALVAACDKLHNLASLVGDVRTHGRGYMSHFQAEVEDQVWYFEGVLEAVRGRIPARLEQELEALIREFRALLPS
jgi:(p)ppGpp synthase/HD superfamily hydrolase